MGTSKQFKNLVIDRSPEEVARLIRMGWEDRTSFEAIRSQFGMSPNEFVKFMRKALDTNSFKRWRRRVFEQGHLKNELKRGIKISRFKCRRQTVDGLTKGWK